MKLGKSAVASIHEITEETVKQLLGDGEISEDWAGVILNTFKEVLTRKDTQLLALLAISCVMSLDWEQFEMFTDGFNEINPDVPKLNSLNYDVLNRVDEGLDS